MRLCGPPLQSWLRFFGFSHILFLETSRRLKVDRKKCCPYLGIMGVKGEGVSTNPNNFVVIFNQPLTGKLAGTSELVLFYLRKRFYQNPIIVLFRWKLLEYSQSVPFK